jgi:hypothetical protein
MDLDADSVQPVGKSAQDPADFRSELRLRAVMCRLNPALLAPSRCAAVIAVGSIHRQYWR